jgi:hypothetical protein
MIFPETGAQSSDHARKGRGPYTWDLRKGNARTAVAFPAAPADHLDPASEFRVLFLFFFR